MVGSTHFTFLAWKLPTHMTSTKTLNHPHYEGDYGESIREETTHNTKKKVRGMKMD